MNKKLEYNRALLNRPSRFTTKELYAKEIKNANLEYAKATPEQLTSIRKKVVRQRKTEAKKTVIKLFLSGLISLAILGLLVYWILLW